MITDRVRLVELAKTYVPGRPEPKGSWKHVGKGHMENDNPREAQWAHDVAFFLRATMKGRAAFDCPVLVRATFYMPRDFIKSTRHGVVHCERATPMPEQAPDVDKLTRSLLDAMKKGSMLVDDGRVVGMDIWKFWAEVNPREAGRPGVEVEVWQVIP
jgi:Holliday junction resolvase RusA-like endonuclease